MFRRKKDEPQTVTDSVTDPDAPAAQQPKGKPTPTRKEAEAARKAALAGVPSDPKEAKRAARDAQRQARNDQQAALRSGDISKLPPRDAGLVRARVRDFVDSRISAGELFIPIAVVVLLLSLIRSTAVANLVLALWSITLLAVAADTAFLVWRLRRTLATEFPDQDRSGAVTYGVMRSLQLRSLRLPKPRVRWNGQPVKPKTPKVKV